MLSTVIPLIWLVYIITSFYLIRPLQKLSHRALLTILPCLVLILIGSHNLQYLHMSSVITVSLYWMIAIRLVHLIALAPDEVNSFWSYAWKFLWFFIPIVPCQSTTPIGFYLISAAVKLFLNHWVFQWLLLCEPNGSYGRVGLFYAYICTGSFLIDVQIALVRLITRNKYSLLDFTNYPFFSKSIREFWGRRYNRLINTFLKESVFDPIRRMLHGSAMLGAFTSFLISGLLHAHVAVAAFGAPSPLPAFLFFFIQGVACCVESMCPFTPPRLLGILLTHAFLLVTSPLYVDLFTRAGPEFYTLNKPLLFDATWIPKLPVPSYCPK